MYRNELLQILRTAFDEGELRDLCFDLMIDYEGLSGQNKHDKARELLIHFERRQRLNELMAAVQQLRPHLDWSIVQPIEPESDSHSASEKENLEQAITAMEAQRPILGDAIVEAALGPLREKIAALQTAVLPTIRQRKYMTILFADVSGFTAMSETMDAEDVSDLMNALWQRLDKAIVDQEGWIDKHMGDAVMALFGTPVAHEDDPERAIQAALTMQAEITAFCGEKQATLAMRIGLNSGPVLLDIVGTKEEFTAMGDTVNLASRLEHAAPVGGVLISHDTYQHVRGLFEVEAQQPLSVKGKVQPIQTYIVIRTLPHMFRATTRGIEGLTVPMIGREGEMSQLQDAFYVCVEDRQMQLMTLTGEAGIGKSRMLLELSHWLGREAPDAWLLQGRATPQMEQTPFALLRHLFVGKFDIFDNDDAVTAREKFVQGITAEMGILGTEKAHFIGRLLGFDMGNSPYLAGVQTETQQIRDRAFIYLGHLFQAVGRKRPIVLFLEDIHWADEATLDWLAYLAQQNEDEPIFIAALARPRLFEKRPNWGEGILSYRKIELKPLSTRQNRQLVDHLLGHITQLPPELRDLIVTQSEGNPFYVEELIKMLVEDGVIMPDETEWQLDMEQLKDLRIPGTLMGVLQARIDRLADEQREMLGQAAVVGRVFWDEAVGYLHDMSEPEFIHEALNALRQRAMVMGRSHSTFGATQEYIFKHALLRDVAYETVLRQLRRRYHTEVAEWLFAKTGDRVQEFAGVIARHYALAEMKAEAAMWYGRSAQQAQASYATATAVEHYQRALALDEKSPKWLGWREGLAQMLALQGHFAEAIEQYEGLLEAAAMSQDRLFEARVWNQLALTQGRQGDYARSMASAQRAEALARPVQAQAILAQAFIRQGWNSYRLVQTETALSQAEQALSLSQEIGDVRQTAESYQLLGAVKYQLASYTKAAQDQDQAIRLYNTLDDLHYTGIMLNNRAETAKAMGELTTAVVLYQKALTIAREMGNRALEMIVQLNLGGILVKLREFETAESELRQLLAQPTIDQAPYHAIAQSHLAKALLGQQQFEPAWQMAQRALITAQTRQLPILTGTAWRTMGQVLAQREPELLALSFDEIAARETTTAARCFAQSLHIFTNNHMKGEQAQTLRAWVEFEEQQGNSDRAVSLQAQAQTLQEEN